MKIDKTVFVVSPQNINSHIVSSIEWNYFECSWLCLLFLSQQSMFLYTFLFVIKHLFIPHLLNGRQMNDWTSTIHRLLRYGIRIIFTTVQVFYFALEIYQVISMYIFFWLSCLFYSHLQVYRSYLILSRFNTIKIKINLKLIQASSWFLRSFSLLFLACTK